MMATGLVKKNPRKEITPANKQINCPLSNLLTLFVKMSPIASPLPLQFEIVMFDKRNGSRKKTFNSSKFPMLTTEFYPELSMSEVVAVIADNLTNFVLHKYNSYYRNSHPEVEIQIRIPYIYDGGIDWKTVYIHPFYGEEDNTNELYFKSLDLFEGWFGLDRTIID